MDDNSSIDGGCYCGAVRYRIAAQPRSAALCHCSDCRRCVGAQSVAWITVGADTFTWQNGSPTRFASSPAVVRTFCGQCGTSLTYGQNDQPEWIDVTTASLDEPGAFPPQKDVYLDQKLGWE